jgi:hypothetical protein
VEGEAPETTELTTTLTSTQVVVERTAEGVVVEVTLVSEAAAPRTAVVVLDRAGSLQAIQQVEGLPVEALGLPIGVVPAAGASDPPDRPLRVGDEWVIADSSVTGDARLERLGVVDDHDVAVVRASLVDALASEQTVDNSAVVLDGDLRSTTTTTFDLAGGAVRRGTLRAHGTVDVLVSPPFGMSVPPVDATITYELRVRTTRLD